MAAFASDRWNLGPLYYCPTCTLPQKELDKGCPRCPLAQKFNYYRDRAVDTIADERHSPGFPDGWPIDRLLSLHSLVSNCLDENQDQIKPDWSVTLAELARRVKQERAQQRFHDDWSHIQSLKLKTKK